MADRVDPNIIDEVWARGGGRCSLCIDMDWDEFQAMCDCSRAHYEATGRQASIQVIGKPETATVVYPIQQGGSDEG